MPTNWWQNSVAYQIYPRSFYDSNGDGLGDLPGIIEKLDYLKTLGVDLLWLTPIFESPDRDNGYDISDYQAIQPRFGTLADARRLIAAAHARGLRIILDLVANHSSDQHPWFIESRKARDNPVRDYYIWRDGVDGAEPNNWRAHFHESAWTYDELTDQYYLGTFSPYQPDLNWESPHLRAALYEMMRWWLDQGIDGFRLDAISFICKAPGLPSHPGAGQYVFDLKHMMHGPDYHAYLREMNQQVFSRYDMVSVGECIDLTVDSALEVSAPERGELNMPFLMEHTNAALREGQSLARLRAILSHWQTGLHGRGWAGVAFDSHDLPRAVSLLGDDGRYREASAKLLGTLLLTLEGTPFIYQGQEIGMTNAAFDAIDDYDDLDTHFRYRALVAAGAEPAAALAALQRTSRDNARTPMQWRAAPQAGFTTGTPWLKVNPNYPAINVEQALADPDSIFHYYRRLIALRRATPALVHGRYDLLLPDHPQIYAYTRTLDNERVLVILNYSPRPAEAELPADLTANAELLISNYPVDASPNLSHLSLRAYEARVYRV